MKTLSLATAALIVTTLGLAGCGGGKSGAVPPSDYDKMVKHATCMEKYGINEPVPDPDGAKGPDYEPDTSDPKWQVASAACKHLSVAPQKEGDPPAGAEERALKMAECLRKLGVKAKDPAPGEIELTIDEDPAVTPEKLVESYTTCNKQVPAQKS